jgi:ABC-type ATPase involved in cell division
MSEIIALSNVTVLDGNRSQPILDGFELHVEKGDLVVLLGPGGSGKSTVFKLLTGERSPETGEITVNGTSVPSLTGGKLARYRRSLGLVMQDAHMIEGRSVQEHLLLPLEIEGMSSERRHERAEAVIERFGLASVRKKIPSMLSMSERQRTAIAMAVVREPLVLLADEPAAHLDTIEAKEIARLLLHENLRGMTVLIGTNDEHFTSYFPEASIQVMGAVEGIEK